MKFDSRFKAQESSGFFVPVIIQSKYFAETTVWIISLIALKKKQVPSFFILVIV